jgi:proline dehydrogenase
MQMMEKYNVHKPVVYNTIQLYRSDRLSFFKSSYAESVKKNFILGAKLVRGAYMEKERKRAEEMNYPSPIHPDKRSTDNHYNEAVGFALDHVDRIASIIATHNEHSNLYATRIMNEKGIEHHHPHVHFSQLYGMSDNVTFNLAKEKYSVSKYLPFGPIEDVIPYLMRRAHENSSVAGQTGRELALIKKEIKRRKRKA